MLFLIARIAFLLLVAMVVGFVAGWLFFGKPLEAPSPEAAGGDAPSVPSTADAPVRPVAAVADEGAVREEATGSPVAVGYAAAAELAERVAAREADVERLRGKLRKAATELERRAGHIKSARQIADQTHVANLELAERLEAAEVERGRLHALLSQSSLSPTLWQAAQDDSLAEAQARSRDLAEVRARAEAEESRAQAAEGRVAEIEARLQETEAELREADSAADQLRVQSEELRARATAAEAAASALRDDVERMLNDHEAALDAVKLDLSAARLRSEAADLELGALTLSLRDAQGETLQAVRSVETSVGGHLRGFSARAEAARAALGGKSVVVPGPAVGADAELSQAVPGLAVLPGITDQLRRDLDELDVRSLRQIAAWSDGDIDRYQALLHDYPGVVRSNDWVGAARRLTGADGGAPGQGHEESHHDG